MGTTSTHATHSSPEALSELRAKGYRQVTLWLPDTTSPGFAEQCRIESESLKNSPAEQRYIDELDLPEVEGWR